MKPSPQEQGTKMKKAPVLEQLDPETQKTKEKIEAEYTVAPDGTIITINAYFDNPETPEKQLS